MKEKTNLTNLPREVVEQIGKSLGSKDLYALAGSSKFFLFFKDIQFKRIENNIKNKIYHLKTFYSDEKNEYSFLSFKLYSNLFIEILRRKISISDIESGEILYEYQSNHNAFLDGEVFICGDRLYFIEEIKTAPNHHLFQLYKQRTHDPISEEEWRLYPPPELEITNYQILVLNLNKHNLGELLYKKIIDRDTYFGDVHFFEKGYLLRRINSPYLDVFDDQGNYLRDFPKKGALISTNGLFILQWSSTKELYLLNLENASNCSFKLDLAVDKKIVHFFDENSRLVISEKKSKNIFILDLEMKELTKTHTVSEEIESLIPSKQSILTLLKKGTVWYLKFIPFSESVKSKTLKITDSSQIVFCSTDNYFFVYVNSKKGLGKLLVFETHEFEKLAEIREDSLENEQVIQLLFYRDCLFLVTKSDSIHKLNFSSDHATLEESRNINLNI